MERLSQFEEHEIGDVHDIVDRLEPYRHEPLLEPFGRGSHLDTLDCSSRVTGSSFGVLYLHGDGLPFPFAVSGHVRILQLAGEVPELQVSVQVPGDTDMRGGIYPVRRDLIFDDGLRLQMQVFPGRSPYDSLVLQDHDPVVGGTDPKLVLSAYHTEGFHSADL